MFQATPDFKGIKTKDVIDFHGWFRFQATPDFKGIKTLSASRMPRNRGFRPPLISKGLRPSGLER